MPFSSPSFPENGFGQSAPNIQGAGAMAGRFNRDDGDVSGHGAATLTRNVGSRVWEALAYLETLETRSRETDALIRKLVDRVAGLEAILAQLGVEIPAWPTREAVLSGIDDGMGFFVPSAAALGLTADFAFIEDQGLGSGQVVGIAPPSGSIVLRGSRITVTCNREF